jgi:hypothetical protein
MHAALNAWVPLTWGLDPDWAWQVRGLVFVAVAAAVVLFSSWEWWRGSTRLDRAGQPSAASAATPG